MFWVQRRERERLGLQERVEEFQLIFYPSSILVLSAEKAV